MKTLKLNATQNYFVQYALSNDYVMTAICEYGREFSDYFLNLSKKEECLLLRYIGGDKKVKIEVV